MLSTYYALLFSGAVGMFSPRWGFLALTLNAIVLIYVKGGY